MDINDIKGLKFKDFGFKNVEEARDIYDSFNEEDCEKISVISKDISSTLLLNREELGLSKDAIRAIARLVYLGIDDVYTAMDNLGLNMDNEVSERLEEVKTDTINNTIPFRKRSKKLEH